MHDHFVIPFFSSMWWQGLGLATGFICIVLFLGSYWKNKGKEESFRMVLFVFLTARFILYHLLLVYTGRFTFQDSLPLHLCGLSTIFCLIFLFKPTVAMHEILLLMSSIGALVSILTPELTQGYSSILYWDYYLSHASLIAVPLYGHFILQFQARPYSWLKVWLIINVIYLITGFINLGLDANYMYSCDPPKVKNPMVMGEFPFYNIGFEVLGLGFTSLSYFLFYKVKWQRIYSGLKFPSVQKSE